MVGGISVGVGVPALVVLLPGTHTVSATSGCPDAIESEWMRCGDPVDIMFVNPPNCPLGESPVTTTEGARTRRGLKIADISPSLVMLTHELELQHE